MAESVLPKKVKTRDVNLSLQKFASNNKLALKNCDFIINHVDTYIKTISDDDFQLYNSDIHKYYEDKEKMINDHVELNQIYTVTLKKITKKIIKLKYTVEFDDYYINPKVIISPDSYIPYESYKPEEILLLLVKELNKIKIKNKILIILFDNVMIKNLKSFVKYIYAKKFKKNIKISLFDGINPTISRQSKLIYWYKEKNLDHDIIEVDKGETVIEYKKAIFGKNGFNSLGDHIKSGSSDNKDDFSSDIDDLTIKVIENNDKKLYKSKIKGFVHFTNNLLSIDNKVRMHKLSRIQTSVAKDESNNIEVHVSQHDTNKDSIGEGVELQSEVIHVTGHVGAKSILEANDLRIDGATHHDSYQHAKDAIINRHKGTLRANTAKIKLLEGGEIHASKVDIDVCLGGSIYAEDVTINQVKSHLKVYASNSITIKLVSGEDNIFKINYKDVPILTNKLNHLNRELKDIKYKLEKASKNNIKKVPELKEKIKNNRLIQDKIRHTTIDAKISIEKALIGLNTIIFTLDTGDEIIYKTDPLLYKPFYIEIHDNKLTLHPVNKTITLES